MAIENIAAPALLKYSRLSLPMFKKLNKNSNLARYFSLVRISESICPLNLQISLSFLEVILNISSAWFNYLTISC